MHSHRHIVNSLCQSQSLHQLIAIIIMSRSLDSSALVAHILSQTKHNLEFLASQDIISRAECREILARLPTNTDDLALSQRAVQLTIDDGPTSRPVPPPKTIARAKALWAYNEDGSDPNDLSFKAGDIIEIITETNADWWTGKHKGRQGLFPSNYVEKLPDTRAAASPAPSYKAPSPRPSYTSSYQAPLGPPPAPAYGPPPGAPPASYQSPPPPPIAYQPPPPPQPVAYNPYVSPAPAPVVQAAPQPQQPSRFGGLGQTMATSAAGGLGFSAGAAIGGDLINAIF